MARWDPVHASLRVMSVLVPSFRCQIQRGRLYLTSLISLKNDFRYKAVGRPQAKVQLTKKSFILSCTGKVDLVGVFFFSIKFLAFFIFHFKNGEHGWISEVLLPASRTQFAKRIGFCLPLFSWTF